jgi:ribonuclease E
MRSRRNQSKLVTTLKEALKPDKARHTVGRISPNGLIEINRQKIEQAIHMRTHRDCPTCKGTGRIGSPEMIGLNLLRLIESQVVTRPIERVKVELHPEVANAFQNDRRREIAALEEEFDLRIEVNASTRLHRSDQEVEWVERKTTAKKDSTTRRSVADRVRNLVAPRKQATPKKEEAAKEPGKVAEEKKKATGRPSRRRRRRKPVDGKPADSQTAAQETSKSADKVEGDKPKTAASTPQGEDGQAGPSRSRSRRRRSPRRRSKPKAETAPTTSGS